jgi:serine/threonine protein kinase
MAQRTITSVEAEVDMFLSNCRFLSRECESDIAKLHRNEIQVGKLLGKGGFSEVYHVEGIDLNSACELDSEQQSLREQLQLSSQEDAESQFVIKHLRPELVSQRTKFNNAAADLVLEAKFLSSLDHPNIIKMRAWAADGIASFGDGSHDSYFLLLDRLDETLAHRISRWRAEPRATPQVSARLSCATQIASALSYLHSNNIMYRDLKCDNIGFKGDTIQLFDLGLCRELPQSEGNEEEVFEMSGVGTLRYMAPEIVMGTGYNLKADVYSFSIVMHEMISLSKPFDLYNLDMYRLLVCEEDERPRLNSAWPHEIQAIFPAMWAKDPSLRPTIQDVHQQLDEMISQTSRKASVGKNLLSCFNFSRQFVRMATGSFCDGTSTTVTSTASIR